LTCRGEPTGQSFKIDGYDAYLASAHGPRAHDGVALLLLTDVIGIWQNSKLVADQYASYGYTTLVIDIFNGDALTLNRADNFDFFSWLKGGSTGDNPHTSDAIDPIVKSAVKYLKEVKGATAIGAAGYCFGAKVS
jgi:dienelactone hydrolase